MQTLFVIDVTRGYLPAALLTAAAYAGAEGEALLVQGAADQEVVRQVVERFRPARILSMVGCTPSMSLGHGGDDAIAVETLPSDPSSLLAWLIYQAVEGARGVVLFPAHSPSWAIKAAVLATRLGYLAWPLEEAAGFAYAAPQGLPILVLGEAPGALTDILQGREFRHLPGDRAVVQYLKERSVPVDYVVLVNSADLEPPSYSGGALGTTWTQGLSLLAPALASYRNVVVVDARTPRADSREIERVVGQKVADTGLQPQHFAVLASPGAVPFIHEPQMGFHGGEDPTRDIHVRLNNDLFFDCAEGRIFGRTAGKVSQQLLYTKHYARFDGAFRGRALLLGSPHVENGITFAIDEAIGRTQLRPMLEQVGLAVTELYDKDCSPAKIAEYLPYVGLAVYGGHGSTEALATHEAPLYAEFLPQRVAPGVVYACACSTMYPRPARHTADGGFSFSEEVTPAGEQIGPAFIDRGALAFVGGLTAEDVLLNSPMYVAFVQALVLKGQSVGQAVRTARNHTLTQLAVLSQSAPGTYADYRQTAANTIQQQIVLGDPAFTPYKGTEALKLPVMVEAAADTLRLTINLPPERWQRRTVAVATSPATKEFHRARRLETWLPAGEDVFNWGENYTVARDATDQSEKGLMGSYIHLTVDLPPGQVPVALALESVTADSQECLVCGNSHPVADATAQFRTYVVPFQGSQPPVKHDQTHGWAFATEEITGGLRIHWLVPALVIADGHRQAIQLRSATFALRHAPGVRAEGRLEVSQGASGRGAPGAMEGTRGHLPDDLLLSFGSPQPVDPAAEATGSKKPNLTVIAQTLSGPGGRWACWLPAGLATHLKIDSPVPVYRHTPGATLSFTPDVVGPLQPGSAPVSLTVKAPEEGTLRGVVLDGFTARPLAGARVRVWQGKPGPKSPIFDGYVGEVKADAQGRFDLTVPVGGYVVTAAHRTDLRFFSGKGIATVYKDRESTVLIHLEPGAVLTGQLAFKGAYTPKHAGIKVIEHGSKEEKVLATGRTQRDGRFEILVTTTTPFDILLQVEGFQRLCDEGGGGGYHLAPGEVLEQSFVLEGEA